MAKLLAVLVCLWLPAGLLACDRCVVGDHMALHQHTLHLRSLADSPELNKPSKSMIAKVKPEIWQITDGVLKRTTAKARFPTIPAVFRWDLIGKVTQWGLHLYERPRTTASRELLEGVLDMVTEVVEAKDFITSKDAELAARLGNITRLHGLLRHFLDSRGSPAAAKLMDAATGAVGSHGAMDKTTTASIIVDMANEIGDPDFAELLNYSMNVATGQVQLDRAHAADLLESVLRHLGAPPAVSEFLKVSADQIRRQVQVDPLAERLRKCRMLAKSARELNLPPSIPEVLDYLTEVTNTSEGQLSPEEGTKILAHTSELFAKVIEQLGSPPSMTELMHRMAGPLINETVATPSEVMDLLAHASRELSLPGAVARVFEYLVELEGTGGTPDPKRIQDLLEKLTEEAGAPEALIQFGREVAVLVKLDGARPDPSKLGKLLTQLLKKLGMPAIADIYAKIGHNLIFREMRPDALTLAAVAPSLTKVLPNLETAGGLASNMRKKLFGPMLAVYEQAVEKLTGQMPESTLKSAFKHVLALARPPA